MPKTGDEVFCALMDLDLILQDITMMGPLKMFLASVDPNNPSLAKLHNEIVTFTARVMNLVNASKRI